MSEDQLRVGKARMKWYKQRDEDKIKTDIAKNDFESMIYKLKDFLNEDENHKYVEEAKRLIYIEQLSELEDWLYDEGAEMNFTVYNNKAKNLTNDYNHYQHLKTEHSYRSEILDKTEKAM
jgi:molecular chaperone DnaK (HSP70)